MVNQSAPRPFDTMARRPVPRWRIPARVLTAAGMAAFALYIAMDVGASLAYDGYSYRDQTIS